MGSLSITMRSVYQEAVPNAKFNNGTRNSDFAQCWSRAEALFLCRVESLDWAKKLVELYFFLEVVYPRYCFQPHRFNQALGSFSQHFSCYTTLPFSQNAFSSFLQKPLLPTTTTFSTFSFPSWTVMFFHVITLESTKTLISHWKSL